MIDTYLKTILLIERTHRYLLEIVKLELEGLGVRDINNVQAMMLFNIHDDPIPIRELTSRGCYLGAHVFYNLKEMVENGYVVQERSAHDRRTAHVRLTGKGRHLRDLLTKMHDRSVEALRCAGVLDTELAEAIRTLHRLEAIPLPVHRAAA